MQAHEQGFDNVCVQEIVEIMERVAHRGCIKRARAQWNLGQALEQTHFRECLPLHFFVKYVLFLGRSNYNTSEFNINLSCSPS